MRKISFAVLTLLIISGCVVDRYGRNDRRYRGDAVIVEPEFWGTVTLVDPRARRIDLDYVGDGGRHYTRQVFYDERGTRWDGVRSSELRSGDQVVVRGRNNRGRYEVESVRRH
jgi:hypothetical protein